mmetsp:Transcript_22791/g.63008  ORF Transcript_22791/g.63008 Transcript_22791/m.63008 type:complete len:268 (-) Transcript_22791:1314-2117(-)
MASGSKRRASQLSTGRARDLRSGSKWLKTACPRLGLSGSARLATYPLSSCGFAARHECGELRLYWNSTRYSGRTRRWSKMYQSRCLVSPDLTRKTALGAPEYMSCDTDGPSRQLAGQSEPSALYRELRPALRFVLRAWLSWAVCPKKAFTMSKRLTAGASDFSPPASAARSLSFSAKNRLFDTTIAASKPFAAYSLAGSKPASTTSSIMPGRPGCSPRNRYSIDRLPVESPELPISATCFSKRLRSQRLWMRVTLSTFTPATFRLLS